MLNKYIKVMFIASCLIILVVRGDGSLLSVVHCGDVGFSLGWCIRKLNKGVDYE